MQANLLTLGLPPIRKLPSILGLNGPSCMSPGAPPYNALNTGYRHAIDFGDCSISFPSLKSMANIYNLCLFQLGRQMVLALRHFSKIDSILHVSFVSVPSEIVQTVISVISIIMTRFHTKRAGAYKSREYQAMGFKVVVSMPPPQRDRLSSTFAVGLLFHNVWGQSAGLRWPKGEPRANAAKIANLVKWKIWNRLPKFLHNMPPWVYILKSSIHQIGSLSNA